MDLGIEGRTALVTGGTGGIGRDICRSLVAEGARCVVVARDRRRIDGLVDELRAGGGRAEGLAGDVTRGEEIDRIVTHAAESFGGLDILVNAAARASGGEDESLWGVDDQLILDDMHDKFLGYVRMSRAAARHMMEGRWGRIVSIGGASSIYAGRLSSGPRNAAVAHLSAVLARELGPWGITSNVVHPGVTRTVELDDRLRSNGTTDVEAAVQRIEDVTATRRLVTGQDIADTVTFLVSERAASLTGAALHVSGGWGDVVDF